MKGGCEEIRLPVIGPSVGRETRREDEWDTNPIYSVYGVAREALAPIRRRSVEAARINLGGDDLCKRLTNLRVIQRHPSRECE